MVLSRFLSTKSTASSSPFSPTVVNLTQWLRYGYLLVFYSQRKVSLRQCHGLLLFLGNWHDADPSAREKE